MTVCDPTLGPLFRAGLAIFFRGHRGGNTRRCDSGPALTAFVHPDVRNRSSRRSWLSEQRPRAMLLSLGHVPAAATTGGVLLGTPNSCREFG